MTDAATPVKLVSFGFRYGIPLGTTVMRDVRDLRNPYTEEPPLKQFTGLNQKVQDWVMAHDAAVDVLDDLTTMTVHAAEGHWSRRGTIAVVAIGCTGGKHRSVTIVERLAKRLRHDHRMVVHLHLTARAPEDDPHLLSDLHIAMHMPSGVAPPAPGEVTDVQPSHYLSDRHPTGP